MNKEVLSQIGNFITRVVYHVAYGPVIEGEVLECRRDKKVPVMHVLLDTGTAGLQQKAFPMSYESFIIPGEPLRINTRSHQYLAFPWSGAERDPFNLDTDQPKTPLSNKIKEELDSLDLENI